MPAFSADDIIIYTFLKSKMHFDFNLALKFGLKSIDDQKSVLAEVMVWCGIGGKSSAEPIVTEFTDAHMLQHALMT